VALVGSTNPGKSSLVRGLTSTDVYIADKLFATLDTPVRRLVPPTEPPVLVTDTVGFIKKLPHDLVASFRSTLDEAASADLLLHVVDAADPAHADHIAVTREVLRDIGADAVPTWILLNKIDRVDREARAILADRYPAAIQLSAKHRADSPRFPARWSGRLAGRLGAAGPAGPGGGPRLVHRIYGRARVLAGEYHAAGTRPPTRAPSRVASELRAALKPAS